ncbi:metacaspase-1-like isoform X2 [Andrographis paniculata]|uniref:metacaspase-1-like isoform X2 n=1 Tax=Andrographis paniculata TaxID=175694 RepID=UPI0021E9654D|nr:metacaspase-1-like isoform X2 [Andrographis paniculata]
MSQIPEKKIMAEPKGFCSTGRRRNSRANSRNIRPPACSLPPEITSGQAPPGKRAVLCCVSYKNQKFELKGTSHDLKNMMDLLVGQFDFPRSSILVLAEKEPYKPPTRANMEAAFQWLTRGIQAGDSLVFYFSGHGLRQRGLHGDEVDGFDESICPVDFETNGVILDNYINKTLVEPMIEDVKLHAIIDSCHSGTVLDLPGEWDANHISSNHFKGTRGGKVISISACEDYQLAADTSGFSPTKEMSGAMTWTFVKAVRNNRNITYQGILDDMHASLKQDDKVGCVGAGLRRVFQRKILQDPLLSSSHVFNTDTKFVL